MDRISQDFEMMSFDIGHDGTWEFAEFVSKLKCLGSDTPGLKLTAFVERHNDEDDRYSDGPMIGFRVTWKGEDGKQDVTIGFAWMLLDDFKAISKSIIAYKS